MEASQEGREVTKDEARSEADSLLANAGEVADNASIDMEAARLFALFSACVYRAAAFRVLAIDGLRRTKATQPAKTGRLPEVGGKIEVLEEQTGGWDAAVVSRRDGDWMEATVVGSVAHVDRYNLLATEGITWRHTDP